MPFKTCHECGKLNSVKLKKCPKCGASLIESAPRPVAQSAFEPATPSAFEIQSAAPSAFNLPPQPADIPSAPEAASSPFAAPDRNAASPRAASPFGNSMPASPFQNPQYRQAAPQSQQPVTSPTAKFCPSCGCALSADSRFCNNCGFQIQQAPQPAPVSTGIPHKKNPYYSGN